jgi:NOL1/NOP2/sun family putative RNA methylase
MATGKAPQRSAGRGWQRRLRGRQTLPGPPEARFSRYREIIPEFSAFCRSLYAVLPTHLRVNTLKASATTIRLRLERRGLALAPTDQTGLVLRAASLPQPGTLLEYALGLFHPQALSSVMTALAMEPTPDDLVLDLCASPGSKTSLLAQLMENRGAVVANDTSSARIATLTANLKRLGVTNTVLTCYAGQQFPLHGRFHRVLVDVPCSAEGTLRTGVHGTLPATIRPRPGLVALQRALLLRAFDLLEPGGTLVYSTCTYHPQENEGAIQFLLEQRPARVQPIVLDFPHSPGLTRWQETIYDPSIQHCWRIYPHQLDTVGFFLARVTRDV